MLSLIVEQEEAHMKMKLLRQIEEVKRTAQRKEEENIHIYITLELEREKLGYANNSSYRHLELQSIWCTTGWIETLTPMDYLNQRL